jgi:hypothetical protein
MCSSWTTALVDTILAASRSKEGGQLMRTPLPEVAVLLFVALVTSGCEHNSRPLGPTEPSAVGGNHTASGPAPGTAQGSDDPARLQDIGEPGGFTIEPLARSAFPDAIDTTFRIKLDGRATQVVHVRDPSDVFVVKLTLEEGGSVGWHTHPGPAIVAVQSGTLGIINAHDCVERHYAAGQAFIDPGQGNVHVGFNAAAAGETVGFVTFLDVPSGQGPTIPAADPGC